MPDAGMRAATGADAPGSSPSRAGFPQEKSGAMDAAAQVERKKT